ncbi:MAG TPA: ABC transporter permease [Conexibacter sp.]
MKLTTDTSTSLSPTADEGETSSQSEPRSAGAARRGLDPSWRYRLQQSSADIVLLFVLLQVGSIVYALANPDDFAYTSNGNVVTALQTIPLLGIPALGVGLLMIAGEFDLSVGANLIFTSIVMGQLNEQGMDVGLAALIAVAIGAGIGLLNGIITIGLKIPSFIATLGTFGFWTAATLFVHGAVSQTFTPTGTFKDLTSGSIGIVPAEALWFAALAVVFWALLQRHRIGNHIFAAGGDQHAALESGVRVNRAKLLAFALVGVCAAVAGVLSASRIGNISPSSNTDLPLEAIAACVIGGLALYGGRGTILGIVVGASLIYWIEDMLLLLAAPSFYLSAFVGVLIIGAAAFYQMLRTRRA